MGRRYVMAYAVPAIALLASLATGCLKGFDLLPMPEDMAVVEDLTRPPPPPPDLTVETVTIGGGPFDFALPPDDGGDTPAGGRDFFEARVWPILQRRCGGCHAGGNLGPGFLVAPAYVALTARAGMITRPASHSLLVTKGPGAPPHDSAAWFNPAEAASVLQWLLLEEAQLPLNFTTTMLTAPQDVVQGANVVSLAQFGVNFSNAKVTFNATAFGGGYKISQFVAVAGGPSGLHLIHPLFVSVRGGGPRVPDPVDSFDGYEFRIPLNSSATIGGGLVLLTNLSVMNPSFSLAFASLTTYEGKDLSGGCMATPDFTLTAQAALTNAGCASMCHGGLNATAKNALDMSRLGDLTMAGQSAVCAQVLNFMDKKTPSKSPLFDSVNPAVMNNHALRFKFPNQQALAAFEAQFTAWLAKEPP